MERQSWSVFVPCFNEYKSLPKVIDKIEQVLETIASQYEIVIVDDGSTDDSAEVIRRIAERKPKVSAVFHDHNKGIGSVQRRAYTTAKFENVIVIASDGQFDVTELLPYASVEPGTWLAFYRQQFPTYTIFRKMLSGVNKSLNRMLFSLDVRDVNWAMVFKSDALEKLDLELSSTLIKSEICIKLRLLGYEPREIPSHYHPRTAGVSKGASLTMVRQAFSDILLLYASINRFRKKISIR